MTVRKITATAISVILLIVGFAFFRLHYSEMVMMLTGILFEEDTFYINITERLFPSNYIGRFFPALFYFSVIILLIARTVDAILNTKRALKVLSSFVLPLILAGIITICLLIQPLNILQLWAIFYVLLLICSHSTLQMILLQSELVGSSVSLKLIKNFFITIKSTIKNVFSTGIKKFKNPIDEVAVLLISGIILLLGIVILISFIFYMRIHWRLIFLSFLLIDGSY